MFLNGTYFQGDWELPQYGRVPNSAEPGELGYEITQTVGEKSLNWFIARYEERFLRELLGDPLFEAWHDGLAEDEPLQIWLDLKSRIYPTVDGIPFSPAANYVYYYAQRSAASDTTMTGEKKQRGSFSDNVPVVRKQVDAWNSMCDQVWYIRSWIFRNRESIENAVQGLIDTRAFWCGGSEFKYINEYGI
jgi:hypothetical protein